MSFLIKLFLSNPHPSCLVSFSKSPVVPEPLFFFILLIRRLLPRRFWHFLICIWARTSLVIPRIPLLTPHGTVPTVLPVSVVVAFVLTVIIGRGIAFVTRLIVSTLTTVDAAHF